MRFLPILFALCLVPTLAFSQSASNIKQEDTPATVWDDGTNTWPAGDSGITVNIADIATAATDYVATNRSGFLRKVIIVPHGNFNSNSNASTFTFAYSDGTTSSFTALNNSANGGTLTVVTNALGQTNTLSISTDYYVTQGGVVAVIGDGGATGATEGVVTIEIR